MRLDMKGFTSKNPFYVNIATSLSHRRNAKLDMKEFIPNPFHVNIAASVSHVKNTRLDTK